MMKVMKVHWLSEKMTSDVFTKLVSEHGWLKGSGMDSRLKIGDVISNHKDGFPVEHIASMIWSMSEGTNRREILDVLNKYVIEDDE